MSSLTTAAIRVLDVPEQFRFEVRVGGELAGFTEYRRRPGLIAFTHTLIDPRFEGQGLGTRLVQTALSEARSEGLAVLPFCPFVRGYIAGHREEYLDLVPANFRDAFELSADA
ncbi:MAG: GNAT family N-acetyltransferase [Solirubrobacteraceae bacterium]